MYYAIKNNFKMMYKIRKDLLLVVKASIVATMRALAIALFD